MHDEDELKTVVEQWRQSLLTRDVAVAEALRGDCFSAILPDGKVLSKEEDLALLAAGDHRVTSMHIDNLHVTVLGKTATTVMDALVEGEFRGHKTEVCITLTITFQKQEDRWRASMSRAQMHVDTPPPPPPSLRTRLRNSVRRLAPTFEELAYFPYEAGSDFALAGGRAADASHENSRLPIPPRKLWLGYNYPQQSKLQVETMLEIARASGLAFDTGDRILDFGCGAGRMIRHLQALAGMCEIWGTDISAEHVLWCKRNLQPPFHFATTTKVPHLPFEDRSFRLVYCGSVFTHIDDLADAWLLELRRVLATDGRLYVTIHDEHTIELWDKQETKAPSWLLSVQARKVYAESKGGFDMFTVGRGHDSQVFYDRDYFLRTVRSMFDVVSVTPEAYFAQTAVLLKRKPAQSR